MIATSDPEQITEVIAIMEKNRQTIDTDVATLVYYMNGGLDYNDAWLLTSDQRKMMAKIIERHFESQNPNKKSKL